MARPLQPEHTSPMFYASSRVFIPLLEDYGLRVVKRSLEVEVMGHLIRAALVATPSARAKGQRGAETFFVYVQKKEMELAKRNSNGLTELQYRKHLVRWVNEYNTYVGGH